MRINKNIIIALVAYIILLILSFGASIIAGLGKSESLHETSSVWMYVRRLLMILCAIGLPSLTGEKGFTAYGWRISPRWLFIAVVAGIAIGFSNKGGFDPTQLTAICLACFHAFATELFFRGYLITTLSGAFKKFWPPVIISSLLYGIFYMTVWTAWNQQGAAKLVFVCLFTIIGIIHGYFYKKSGTFLVPWVMHFFGVLKYKVLF